MFDKRRSQRFPLRLPFKLLGNRDVVEVESETCNVSSKGVAFEGFVTVQPGERVEYVITLLHDVEAAAIVRLRCVGKMVRIDDNCCAATMDRYDFVREPADLAVP